MISIKRAWVQVPIWVLAGFESQRVGSSPNLSYMLSFLVYTKAYTLKHKKPISW